MSGCGEDTREFAKNVTHMFDHRQFPTSTVEVERYVCVDKTAERSQRHRKLIRWSAWRRAWMLGHGVLGRRRGGGVC